MTQLTVALANKLLVQQMSSFVIVAGAIEGTSPFLSCYAPYGSSSFALRKEVIHDQIISQVLWNAT